MWSLWVVPLLVALPLTGVVVALVWYFASPKGRRPRIGVALAVPLGCVSVPVIGVALLAAFGSLTKSSDTDLFEEMFGYRPTITEDRMLFDDFGGGENREIWLRVETNDRERARLLAIPGLAASDLTLDQFIALGNRHGFMWWVSSNLHDPEYCRTARILDAPGYRGWAEFRIARCTDAGDGPFAAARADIMYVVASGRR